jgi:hypothetical protein
MASFGVALMLRNIVVIFFGPEPIYYAFAIQPALRLWGIRITPNEIVVVAVTAALVVCLHLSDAHAPREIDASGVGKPSCARHRDQCRCGDPLDVVDRVGTGRDRRRPVLE